MPASKQRRASTGITLGLAGAAATALVAAAATRAPVLGFGVVGLIVLLIAMYRRPRIALVIWLVTLTFVPTWIGVEVGGFIPASSVIAVVVLISTLGSRGWALSRADLVIVGLIVVGLLAVTFYDSSLPVWVSMITQWLVSYLAAKAAIAQTGFDWAAKALMVVLAVVACFTLLEFVFHWHPFVNLGPESDQHVVWGPIQIRGGVERSEWAFGHAIALAGALAAAVPLVLGSRLGGVRKALLTLLLTAAVATTFSRAGLIAVALGVFLSLAFQTQFTRRQKVGLTTLLIAATAVLVPTLGRVFDAAGDEASNSSSYRSTLLDLIPTMRAIGRSTAAAIGGDGSLTYGRFRSIDNTFLQLGLGYGWIVAAIAVIPFVVIAVRLLARRGTSADIVLLTQVPMLTTVAMITQWQSVVWLLAGAAVIAAQERARAVDASLPTTDSLKKPALAR